MFWALIALCIASVSKRKVRERVREFVINLCSGGEKFSEFPVCLNRNANYHNVRYFFSHYLIPSKMVRNVVTNGN